MDANEKLQMAKRKKLIGVKCLKGKEYKRALKIFEHINSLFGLGSFTEQEKELTKTA